MGHTKYLAFVDPSGGSHDSMTLAIVQLELKERKILLTLLREVRPPFSPETVAKQFAEICRAYRIAAVVGDRYGGEWPREQFAKHGVNYITSSLSKSEIYNELLPLLNSGRVELLDNQRLISQLTALERRTGRSGRDSVDHPPRGHDDVANAAAGAIVWMAQLIRKAMIAHPPERQQGIPINQVKAIRTYRILRP